MPIGDVCVREVLVAERTTTVRDAARMMRENHVGDLVVMEPPNGHRRPAGLVTDRDIVISVVATGLDPAVFTVGDLLTRDLVTVHEDEGILKCMQHMRSNGVRRMPIVDDQGGLVGIVSIDDLFQMLSEEMGELSKLISREQAREKRTKR
jgi:CBS domain-containing protein